MSAAHSSPPGRHDALPRYLTAEDVAALLQVSVKSVYRWAKDDPTMPTLRLGGPRGGVVRFPEERLLAWLRSREQGMAMRRSRKQVHGDSQLRAVAALEAGANGSCAVPCAEGPA